MTSVIAAAPAYAHDKLIGSNPADASTVYAVPAAVTVYFEEPPGAGFTELKVFSPAAQNIDAGAPSVTGSQLSVPVRHITQAGQYTIQFGIVSDDGHPVGGVLHFTISDERGATSSAAAAGNQSKSAGSASLGWLALPVLVVSVIGLGLLGIRSIRSPTRST